MATTILSPETPTPQPPALVFSGFWRRVFAFAIDTIVLGVVGVFLGALLFDAFVRLGPYGRLLGFAISMPYFGVMNSQLFGGRSIGKRALGIMVCNASGRPIGIGRSLGRSSIYLLPYFLNGAEFHQLQEPGIALTVAALIIFGVGGAVSYLLIFNKPSRRSLHDYAVGTCVVRSPHEGPVDAHPIWKGHVAVIVVLGLTVAALSQFLSDKAAKSSMFSELFAIQQDINKEGKYQAIRVFKGKTWRTGGGSSNYLTVTVRVKSDPADQGIRNEVMGIVLRDDPKAMEEDALGITAVYGYDIGIATAQKTYSESHTPKEWQDQISHASN
jgi:uncharacterized RDD family membrane protein YckC